MSVENAACYMCRGPACNLCGKFGKGAFASSFEIECGGCGCRFDGGSGCCPVCGWKVPRPGETISIRDARDDEGREHAQER